ncbi:MAG: hypothetical protein JSR62_04695 [Nitrospira sp.]|nr:hypothetical protein [Nitrospira sp.]
MMPVLTGYGRVTCALLLLWFTAGCAQSALHHHSPQEDLGMGIVSGTLGAQARSAQPAVEPITSSVVGQVQALEGGAYLVRDIRGQEHRIPHDENTKIDRPAHVGDRIQSWFDRHGRAVLIRSVEEENR